MRLIHELLLPWKSNEYYILTSACVRACVRSPGYTDAWASACAYVHIALLIQHATLMRHILKSLVFPWSLPHFFTLSHKRCDCRKNIKHKTCAFIFSITFV